MLALTSLTSGGRPSVYFAHGVRPRSYYYLLLANSKKLENTKRKFAILFNNLFIQQHYFSNMKQCSIISTLERFTASDKI
jgi:hypothetical protein